MSLLKDKVVIVTGSTIGIGEGIARKVIEEEGKVLIHGLEEAEGEALLDEFGEDRAALHIDDLRDPASAGRIVDRAVLAFGRIDALVNNAGIVIPGTIETTDCELFQRVMDVNVRAPMLLIQAALPHLKKTKGSILNIGSINAYCGEPELLPYSMSKGALMTMSRNLGDTLNRQGVRVNHINPGWVLTANEQKRKAELGMDPDWPSQLPDCYAPSGRILAPAEIAAAVVLFISDALGPVSGTVLELEQFPIIGRNPSKV